MPKFNLSSVARVARRAVAAPVVVAATVAIVPAATAQTAPEVPGLSSEAQNLVGEFSVEKLTGTSRDDAWNTRNELLAQLKDLNPQAASTLAPVVDGVLDATFPGLKEQKLAEAQAARDAAARAQAEQAARERALAEEAARKAEEERQRNQFDNGPCPADAAVCVDIDGRRTWLQDDGRVTYISPSMAPGKPGQETPRGTFFVNRKVKDEISYEFNNAPMPYAIYFTNAGHAFHLGDPAYDSAGCVRLPQQAALKYWENLQIGDKVFIY